MCVMLPTGAGAVKSSVRAVAHCAMLCCVVLCTQFPAGRKGLAFTAGKEGLALLQQPRSDIVQRAAHGD